MSHALPPLLALGYLLAAQLAVFLRSDGWALVAGLLLGLLILSPGLLRGRPLAWLALLLLAAGLLWLQSRSLGLLPLYAPPVLLNLFLAWLFGHTLRGGRAPLIERVIRAMGAHPEPIDPAILSYARSLTRAWTIFFVALALLNLGLAMIASPNGLLLTAGITPPLTLPQSGWSLFSNALNYLLVGAFFVIEFAYRKRRFAVPYRNLADFFRQMARLGPAFWRNVAR